MIARRWHEWKIGERRLIKTLTFREIQSQVGKFRSRHQECKEWRWRTKTVRDGILVERVK